MSDHPKSDLQVMPKDGGSALTVSNRRPAIVARGREDAALLGKPPEGICNKCSKRYGCEGIQKPLVFAGRICADCSEVFDRNWADSTVTDWVLVTFPGPDQLFGSRRSWLFSIVAKLVQDLELSSEDELAFVSQLWPYLYVYIDTDFAQMKLHWAICEPPDSLCIGRMPPDEVICSVNERWEWPSGWPRDSTHQSGQGNVQAIPFIRPATPQEAVESKVVGLGDFWCENIETRKRFLERVQSVVDKLKAAKGVANGRICNR